MDVILGAKGEEGCGMRMALDEPDGDIAWDKISFVRW